MLQVRVSIPEFSSGINFTDPIILEMADDISLPKTLNSSDESISFKLPITDPKLQYVTYLRWWECWDTVTNTRLNYGPITEISASTGDNKQISGLGRSEILNEFIRSVQTFYLPITTFFKDLLYENISAGPRTSTIINTETDSEYYGLSKRTKDYAIDEQTGWIAIGRDAPAHGTIKSDTFWTGTGRADWLVIDLGMPYKISKASILLPWWGGLTINNDRTYEYSFSYSNDNISYTPVFTVDPNTQGKFGAYGGTTPPYGNILTLNEIEARYWKLDITNTHAWGGNYWYPPLSEIWNWECGGSNALMGRTKTSPAPAGSIPKTELSPMSDCYASAVEIGVFRKIMNVDNIPNLTYHQIQGDNRQITYYHAPEADEMITAGSGKKFEPGTFFRKVDFAVTGTTTIKDEYNSILYSGGGASIVCPAYSRLLLFSNATAQLSYVDTWKGLMDAFSYGGSYSYSDKAGDSATLHFRGVSLKWIATIPAGKTAGIAKLELRAKDNTTGSWGSWSTLEAGLVLPTDVAAYKVWEITYESGQLLPETVYEFKITNLNGGYVSIDSFAGYWSGSFTEYNQDDDRVALRQPNQIEQVWDQKLSFGSAFKFGLKGYTKQGLGFTGDRCIVYSRKGPGYGLIEIGMAGPSIPGVNAGQMHIPGGNAAGLLRIDLNSTYDQPQAIIFDSNDYFTSPGLKWDSYSVHIYKPTDVDPIWVDGIGVHERSGVSVKFLATTHLQMLKDTAEVLQLEWDITESGLLLAPRLGADTDIIFAEGRGTTISIEDVEDSGEIATMLFANGADIDGLPLTTVVENKETRKLFGRTIQRSYDYRNVGDYFTLIGASRTELLRRRVPQKRITVQYAGSSLPVTYGDSFIIKTASLETRVRAMTITRNQSANNGTSWTLECLEWPLIS